MASASEFAVPRIKLGSQGLEVSALGLGCMGMSAFYGPPKPEPEMIDLVRFAVDSGITHLDTAEIYGPHTNEILLGKALEGGLWRSTVCAGCLKRLGVECIDLYYQHRIDTRFPIEITVGELKKLVEEGKIKYIGLSEASASTIRRANAVQLEWSLCSRDVEEDVIPTCRELGIGIVAYSPLGRGFFSTGPTLMENLAEGDFRKLESIASADAVKGGRYESDASTWKTSDTPPLATWKST